MKKKNMTLNVLIFVFVMNITVGGAYLSHYYCSLKENENLYQDMRKTVIEREVKTVSAVDKTEAKANNKEAVEIDYATQSIDFDALQKVNRDIYAWITIPNTKVDYPIFQHGQDNTYYLNHNVDGSQGYPGCIYTEKYTKKDFLDFGTILYGHSMKNGTIFGSLYRYEDRVFFQKNPYIYVYTPDKTFTYQIVIATDYDDSKIEGKFDMKTKEGVNRFLQSVLKISTKNVREEFEVQDSTKILVLSTCKKDNDSRRYLVIGKLLERKQ